MKVNKCTTKLIKHLRVVFKIFWFKVESVHDYYFNIILHQ